MTSLLSRGRNKPLFETTLSLSWACLLADLEKSVASLSFHVGPKKRCTSQQTCWVLRQRFMSRIAKIAIYVRRSVLHALRSPRLSLNLENWKLLILLLNKASPLSRLSCIPRETSKQFSPPGWGFVLQV